MRTRKENPNGLSSVARLDLKRHNWDDPNKPLDLMDMGVRYFDPEIMPAHVSPETYASYKYRGLCPPQALPIHTDEETHERVKWWFANNYFKLNKGGVHHLGCEFNIQREEEWDEKKLKVCFLKVSDYDTIDGSFGTFLVWNFIKDYGAEDIFCDFAFFPSFDDLPFYLQDGIPLWFGNITKRPVTDFDLVVMSTAYPAERVNTPIAFSRSGLPLYRWMRRGQAKDGSKFYPKMPVTSCAGIGGYFIENLLGDNPRYGTGQDGLFDHVLIGEGEMLDLKYFQSYLNDVLEGGLSIDDWFDRLDNERVKGLYDPTRVLFEYKGKVVIFRDFEGNEVGRKEFPQGGEIERISLIDEKKKRRIVLAGPESEESKQLEPVHEKYTSTFMTVDDTMLVGDRYLIDNLDQNERSQKRLT